MVTRRQTCVGLGATAIGQLPVADGSEPAGRSPEEFQQMLLADVNKWVRLVKESGVKFE